MTYTYNSEEYLKVWSEYLALAKVSFSSSEPKKQVIAKLEEISIQKRRLAEIANNIVRERIEFFEKNPDAVTEEIKEDLINFFLFLNAHPMEGQRSTDDAIYYRALLLIKDYAKKVHNVDLYTKYIYNCALWYNNFYGSHIIEYTGSPFYEEVLNSLEHFDEIPYLARSVLPFCLPTIISNSSKTYVDNEKELEKVWIMYDTLLKAIDNHKKLCEKNPPTPDEIQQIPLETIDQAPFYFETYAMQAIAAYGILMLKTGKRIDNASFRERIEPMLAKYRDIVYEENIATYPISLFISFYALEYILGNIGTDKFLNQLEKLCKKCDSFEDPVARILYRGAVERPYLDYLRSFGNLPVDEVNKICRQRLNEIIPMMLDVAHSKEDPRVNMALFECFSSASYSFEFSEFANTVLELTIYSDKALFIHTIMVREMSRVIFDYMFEHDPVFFDGVCGYNTSYIKEHIQEMRSILDDSCLYHDIGKVTMLDVVENSLRKLTNDEFEFIKTHPHGFNLIYSHIDENDPHLCCIRDCALTHHLWHDGTRGYPMDVRHTKNRPFSDIISIADSIDAATDFLGRPYNSGKTIDELILEFQSGAGNHYGPEVAKVLSVPEVRDKLHYLINEGRKEIYYQVYVFNKVDNDLKWSF